MKEWVRATRGSNGPTIVTVTLQDGNLTTRWSTKAYASVKAGVKDSRERARALLDELKEATEE